ncbi:RING-H2 finger protein ATL43 [Telopea speciosissima]|uniref:RING-H2 finger protein ATL43 n=1 Tax=Telopea speciosissima TaxID=54955 RepID=UPI001CC3D649|nr:RING-H2 finger protein ATL43 [Telopea speciosissima]
MPLSSLFCIFPENPTPTHRFPLCIRPPETLILFQKPVFPEPEMGVSSGLFRFLSFWDSFLLFFFFTFCFRTLMANDGTKPNSPSPNNADPSPPRPDEKSNYASFRPSIAVIVGVLTTIFSITFLLLLYAKHCKRNNGARGYAGNHDPRVMASTRKNSGIDRSVIDSLPIFRFSSLRGQKEGLECAVCLTKFESMDVLRLLPKCKHAFHFECVDTWLDAHSTCPLCRYRVDPEDVLLVDESRLGDENDEQRRQQEAIEEREASEVRPSTVGFEPRRVSGRHSSAGEKTSGFLQIVVHRSDGGNSVVAPPPAAAVSRRSLDIASLRKKKESVTVGCFDRGCRKDGLLLSESELERRLEHRIIVSDSGLQQRWSDLQPSDLLFLRSEMIITESGRYSSLMSARPSISTKHQQQQRRDDKDIDGTYGSGRNVINVRSVSEITGLSRFPNRTSGGHEREREERVIKRWWAWASQQRRTGQPNS